MRTFVGHFLIHLALSGVLVVALPLRVLCYSSCLLEAGPMAADTLVGSDATPACHDDDTRHHSPPASYSAPLQDDCTHDGGASSFSSLSTSATSIGGDGPNVPVITPVAVTHLSVVSSHVPRDATSIPNGGQLLGRFLTPLRI